MKKDASSKQLQPSLKEIKEHSSFYISMGLLILLCSSFVYNFGYFLLLDVKLLGLLTLGDYYEGTIPYIIIFCTISLLNYIFYLRFSAQTSITTVILALIKYFSVFFRCIRIFYKCALIKIKIYIGYNKKNKTSKKLAQKNQLIKKEEQCYNELKDVFKKSLSNIAILIVFVVILATPLIGLFLNLKIITLKGWIFITFFLFPLWMALRSTPKGRKIFTLIIMFLIVLITGISSFKQAYNNESVHVHFTGDDKTYSLIRSITNGYIVRYDKNVYFFPKDSLNGIKIESNIKDTNNDAE